MSSHLELGRWRGGDTVLSPDAPLTGDFPADRLSESGRSGMGEDSGLTTSVGVCDEGRWQPRETLLAVLVQILPLTPRLGLAKDNAATFVFDP